MAWIGAPTPLDPPAIGPGWTGAPEALPELDVYPGWLSVAHLAGGALGTGFADAELVARLVAEAVSIGAPEAALVVRGITAAATGAGIPSAAAAYAVLAEAIGQGHPGAAAAQAVAAAAAGTGNPAASAIARLTGAALGTGTPSASAVDVSPYTIVYTNPGDYVYDAPLGRSTFDLVGVGAGGGGDGTGPFSAGKGGARGVWNSVRLVRGVNFSATATTIAIHVGDGGSTTFAYYTSGGPGDVVRFTYLNQSGVSTTLTCNGGAGGGSSNSTGQATSPNPYIFQGVSYPGGTGSSNNPGSGGNGAPYGTILSQFGARGYAWVRAV